MDMMALVRLRVSQSLARSDGGPWVDTVDTVAGWPRGEWTGMDCGGMDKVDRVGWG